MPIVVSLVLFAAGVPVTPVSAPPVGICPIWVEPKLWVSNQAETSAENWSLVL